MPALQQNDLPNMILFYQIYARVCECSTNSFIVLYEFRKSFLHIISKYILIYIYTQKICFSENKIYNIQRPNTVLNLIFSEPTNFWMCSFKTGNSMIHSPSHSTRFHLVGQFNVFGINIKLPLPLTKYTSQYSPSMYADSHVNW